MLASLYGIHTRVEPAGYALGRHVQYVWAFGIGWTISVSSSAAQMPPPGISMSGCRVGRALVGGAAFLGGGTGGADPEDPPTCILGGGTGPAGPEDPPTAFLGGGGGGLMACACSPASVGPEDPLAVCDQRRCGRGRGGVMRGVTGGHGLGGGGTVGPG